MTGGQVSLDLNNTKQEVKETQNQNIKVEFDVSHITIDENDQTEHEKFLKLLSKKSKQEINW
jgi:sugar phosphate isomerase/epimerase